MIIIDSLYGRFSVSKLIDELISSKPMQRLKGIHQGGGIFLVNPELTLTRYEHSVGVMLLIKLLGGTEIEQIAGLLHDVSHTAFSHVIDYIFEHPEEDYHEEIYQRILIESEIPAILERYGYGLKDLLEKDFNILEQLLPNLCADRIDYAVRDLFYAGFISLEDVQGFISKLIVHDGRIMMTSVSSAQWFTKMYAILNKEYFGKKEHLYANEKLTEILKYLLTEKVIAKKDFEKDDIRLLGLVEANSYGKHGIEAIRRLDDFDGYNAANFKLKPRVIDPELYIDGQYFRLSHI
ncbi:HD domain-containing protein [Pedobacter sp. NJ-S-72]